MRWKKMAALVLAALLFVPFVTFAQPGIVSGNVMDSSTGEPLVGANITLEGTSFGTSSGRGGQFRISAVSTGSYNLLVSYLGYLPFSTDVQVTAGETTNLTIELTSQFLEGEEVVFIAAQRSGQARALNQQRTAPNIVNVIASDQIGSFPDPNVAEALQRIPAVAIQRDQGEGRYVTIRGTEPNLNNVTINGERVPSPEGDVRQVAMDVIPSDQLAGIEIHKALTPDMDGDAIGGSINLVTRSALDYDRPFGRFELGGGYNNISSGGIGRGSFTYGRRFGVMENIGVMISGSYNVTQRGSDNNEMEWGEEELQSTGEDAEVLQSLELRDYTVTRTRAALSTSLDYAWNANSRNYLRFIWNSFGDQEYRRRVTFSPGDYVDQNTIEGGEVERDLKDRYEVQRIWSLNAGGDHLLMNGLMEWDYGFGYSYAEEEEPDYYGTNYKLYSDPGVWEEDEHEWTMDTSDPDIPQINLSSSSNSIVNNAGNWLMDEVEYSDNLTTDTELSIQTNLRHHLDLGGNPAWVKAGFKYRSRNKDRENRVVIYSPEDDFALSELVDNFDSEDFLGGDYDTWDTGMSVEPEELEDFVKANPNDFEVEEDPEEDSEDYDATENIVAGYLMGSMNYGNWMFLAGARMEMTDLEYDGYQVILDEDGDYEGTNPVSGTNDYVNVMPMIHVRYALNDRTNFRLAWTNSIARPNFYDIVPYQVVSREDEEIERGNSELDPATAMNIDLMAEHYFTSLGILSGGFFMKNIDNYIYTQYFEQSGGTYDGYEVSSPDNGDAASLYGFEIAWNQQFGFLPNYLSGLGVYTNYTYTTSTIDYILDDGTKRESVIPGQSENMINFALTYEKYGFSGRLSLNYFGELIGSEQGQFGGFIGMIRIGVVFSDPRRFIAAVDIAEGVIDRDGFDLPFTTPEPELPHQLPGYLAVSIIKQPVLPEIPAISGTRFPADNGENLPIHRAFVQRNTHRRVEVELSFALKYRDAAPVYGLYVRQGKDPQPGLVAFGRYGNVYRFSIKHEPVLNVNVVRATQPTDNLVFEDIAFEVVHVQRTIFVFIRADDQAGRGIVGMKPDGRIIGVVKCRLGRHPGHNRLWCLACTAINQDDQQDHCGSQRKNPAHGIRFHRTASLFNGFIRVELNRAGQTRPVPYRFKAIRTRMSVRCDPTRNRTHAESGDRCRPCRPCMVHWSG